MTINPANRKEATNSRLNRAQERRSKTGHQEGLERKDLELGELRTRSQAAKAGKEISRKTPLKNKTMKKLFTRKEIRTMTTRNENSWKPSFVYESVGIYYKDKACELACYVLEFTGWLQISKLYLNEVEESNYEMALIWYKELEKIVRTGSFKESTLTFILARARALLKDVTGVTLRDEDINPEEGTTEEPTTEETTTEEPKRFTVGGKAVYGNQVETVVKVTKCYVWFTYCGHTDELQKRKIKKGANGDEYVEFQETGWGRGNCQWYTYRAA